MTYSNNTGLPSVTTILNPYIDTQWFTEEHTKRGSAVHAVCESHLKGLYVIPLREDYQPYFDSFRRWVDLVVDSVVLIEERLIDKVRGYCGQPDAIFIFRGDSAPSLWDWKTSQSYQSWWALQGAAYRRLAETDRNIKTIRGGSVRLKKDGSGCLADPWPDDPTRHFNIFTGLLNAHRFFSGGK